MGNFQGLLLGLLLLLSLSLLCELHFQLLHVVEKPIVLAFSLHLILLLGLLFLLSLLLILLGLLDLDLIKLLFQELLPHLQLLSLFYAGLIFLLLLFNAITD